jgi:hypothetical protein
MVPLLNAVCLWRLIAVSSSVGLPRSEAKSQAFVSDHKASHKKAFNQPNNEAKYSNSRWNLTKGAVLGSAHAPRISFRLKTIEALCERVLGAVTSQKSLLARCIFHCQLVDRMTESHERAIQISFSNF